MAIYNEILTGRYARMFQKLFGMKGAVPTKQLSGEVMPVLPIFSGAEHRYLESWDRYSHDVIIAAQGPGNFSSVRLRNPAGSNVIGVIEKITLGNTGNVAAGTLVGINLQTGAIGDLQTGGFGITLDSRSRPNSAIIPSFGFTGGGVPFAIATASVPAQTVLQDIIVTDIQEFPLLPNTRLEVIQQTGNLALGPVIIFWRERFLEESERS